MVCLLLLPLLSACYGTAIRLPSTTSSYEQDLVERAAYALGSMRHSREIISLDYYLEYARGVLIFPGLINAGLIYGGKGGNGVLVAKDENGNWSDPAFYTFGGMSWGPQVGIQKIAAVLVFMNGNVLSRAIDTGITLNVSAGFAAGAAGKRNELSTVTLDQDIYCFTDVRGLFAGLSLEGGVIKPRPDLNESFYGSRGTPEEIILGQKPHNPAARILRNALAQALP